MVIRALETLQPRSITPTRVIDTPEVRSVTPTRNICRKLEMSHLTPVKGSHLQHTDRCVTAESRLLFISKCDNCGELVQPSNRRIPRNCLKCNTPLGLPVEYAINDDIHFDESVLARFPASAPTPVELIMAGMGLSATERETQANNKYIRKFLANHTRKTSHTDTLTDLFHRLLEISDPVLVTKSHKSEKSTNRELTPEMRDILVIPEEEEMDKSSSGDDID